MIEEAREEVKGLVRRVEWLADVVLLLLIPDIIKLLSREWKYRRKTKTHSGWRRSRAARTEVL